MKRLLILILAMFVVAAPVPALATQAMCADAMPVMASMDHGMKKGSCCDEKHKACMLACDAMCVVALATPAPQPSARAIELSVRPLPQLVSFTIAKPTRGLDPPPRNVA
ncbi:MAG: hypothetical protein A4S12_04495 [Proteobacteria bacterium SG_bin5]|uniref:hypothetical protein n=2 Tax=unclassified Sphingomonas TaxID=196159 RepID=UPI000A0B15B4|nr:hypothetical protein [Sphingomonas sp.]OQW43637.1 MAG: hypothetical protein A4S12_04495 [Proteobacteria bacterium SG_bin5]